MIVLPALLDFTKVRPNRPQFEGSYLVPDFKEHPKFWEKIHHFLYALSVKTPLSGDFLAKVNPFCGYFGNRIHPVTLEPQYYHLGIEAEARSKQQVKPILHGILEYSGYSPINGYYVLLSHPHIQTEDGYILHTMYCHLKKPLVKFSSYQKMLREISLGSHPILEITTDTVLGLVGSSGVTVGDKPKLYLQCDFRKFDHRPLVVDPMNFYSEDIHVNESHNMTQKKEE